MTTPGPGWHPDPEGNQQLRYWDGQQWTSATQPMPQPTPPPEPVDPAKLAKDRRRALVGAGVVAVLIAAYFGVNALADRNDDSDTVAAATTTTQAATTTTSSSVAPTTTTRIPALPTPTSDGVMRDFWLRVDRDGYATMNVNGTYTDAELESAFNEQMRMWKNLKEGDGWFIFIECGDGMNATGGARQANGKFAITSLGAARTGLSVGGSEFEALPNRKPCPPVGSESSMTTADSRPAGCREAPAEYLDIINSSFLDGYSFGETKAIQKGELWYIGGQIHNAEGGIRSRDDLFVAKDMIVTPVTVTARNQSTLPDLRKVLDVSFSDPAATAALDCARTY